MEAQVAPESQREVQRQLGRCLLRLQQYEKLFKSLLAHQNISVAAQSGQPPMQVDTRSMHTYTLGTLARIFSESYLQLEGAPEAASEAPTLSPTALAIHVRMGMEVSPETFARMTSELKTLVALRNELVHHLIDRFDLWSEQGCKEAIAHLIASYGQIDAHFAELQRWTLSMKEAVAVQAQFMQSIAFEDVIFNGIAPDGTVDWPNAGIVRALRGANQALVNGGWVRLDEAVEWVCQHEAEQSPGKYGCKSWPDVLHKSRAFRLEYRIDEAGRKVVWYRPRP